MSEGTLSQDEIDALLGGSEASVPGETGMESGGLGNLGQGLGGVGGTLPGESILRTFLEQNKNEVQQHFVSTVADSFQLSLDSISRIDSLSVQEDVVVIAADLRGPISGIHSFVLTESDALRLLSPLLGANVKELNEAALTAIQENFEQLGKVLSAALSFQFGRVTLNRIQVSKMNRASALPPGSYFQAAYSFELTGGAGMLYEIFDENIVEGMNQNEDTSTRGSSRAGAGMGLSSGAGVQAEGTTIQSVQFPQLQQIDSGTDAGNLGLLMDVSMEMTVELGRTKKLIREILSIGEGTIIELDKLAGEPVDILVNHKLIAKGEVVVIDENFGVRVTEIVTPFEKFQT